MSVDREGLENDPRKVEKNKSDSGKKGSSRTPKRLRPSIKFDPMSAHDYLNYDFRFACEDCSHFDSSTETCTIGYHTQWHRRDFQRKSFELGGKMALCRFIEID